MAWRSLADAIAHAVSMKHDHPLLVYPLHTRKGPEEWMVSTTTGITDTRWADCRYVMPGGDVLKLVKVPDEQLDDVAP